MQTFAPSVQERIAELEAEYDRLSDQGRDTTEVSEELAECRGPIKPTFRDPQVALEMCEEVAELLNEQHDWDWRLGCFRRRGEITAHVTWALPSREALRRIAGNMEAHCINDVVDCGCGHALWPALLAPMTHPTSWTAWDITAPPPLHVAPGLPPFMAVTKHFPDFKPECLSFIWPTYDDPWSSQLLARVMPEFVLYVGEGCGGCTGDEAFHEILSSDYNDILKVEIPRWPGIYDSVYMFQRKPKA